MGTDSINYWPGDGLQLRQIYRDSEWSSAVGASFWHQAPVMSSLYSPHEFCVDYDDFHDYATSNYTATLNSGTVALSTSVPGGVAVVTSAGAATETTIQKIFVWNLHASKVLYTETMLSLDQVTEGDMFVGLLVADTSPIASDPASGVWFSKVTTDTAVHCRTGSASSWTTESLEDVMVDATNMRFGIAMTTGYASFFLNGVHKSTIATNIPAASVDLRWCVSVKGTATPVALAASVNYHKTLQAR